MTDFNFVENTFTVPYTEEVADYCDPFCCGDEDLDEFFSRDVFLYEEELLDNHSRNALQRKIPHQKRHRSYPAVLIGRLGVSRSFRGHGLNVGTQLMNAKKMLLDYQGMMN